MHADTLIWGRNFVEGDTRGHVDLPRMISGGVALQVFTIVTGVPRGFNMERTLAPQGIADDSIALVAFFQRWGLDSILSRKSRGEFQAKLLSEFSKKSEGRLWLIQTKREFEDYLVARKKYMNITAGVLGIEGLHCLEGNLSNVDLFYKLGVRTMGITHFFDNELGGSAHGENKGGLTQFGKEVVHRMSKLGIVVDVAHASDQVIEDVLNIGPGPVISTHHGVYSLCPSPRNLKDSQIKKIAESGGYVSIGFFRPAICGDNDLTAILDAIMHVCKLVGPDHVALGSDNDGSVNVPFDITGLIHIVNGLLSRNVTEKDIHKIMGGNAKNLLLKVLPK